VLYCPHLKRDIRQLLDALPSALILTGLPTVPGEAGCLQMHQLAVSTALEQGATSILVVEDDCLLTDSFSWDRVIDAVVFAEANGYGCIQGGSVLATDPRQVAPGLLAVGRACSAHFMVYLQSGYEAVLAAEQPFDLSIADKGIRPLLMLPFVAIQKRGLSGIGLPLEAGASKTYAGPHEVDYEWMFAAQERHLLQGGFR
jgi:hypothetical protein